MVQLYYEYMVVFVNSRKCGQKSRLSFLYGEMLFGTIRYKGLSVFLLGYPHYRMCSKVLSEMFEDTEGVEVIVDDLLIWGENTTRRTPQNGIRMCHVTESETEQRKEPNKTYRNILHWLYP